MKKERIYVGEEEENIKYNKSNKKKKKHKTFSRKA